MQKRSLSNPIFWMLLLAFLTIPVADFRVHHLVPLYTLDAVCLGILTYIIISFQKEKKDFRGIWQKQKGIFLALLFFILSASMSYVINNPTLTGLGQLKSWITLPSLTFFAFALVLKNNPLRDRDILYLWLFGLSGILLSLLPYLFYGVTTFDNRLQGIFTSPNFLALFLFPGALLSFWFFTQEHFFKKKIALLFLGTLFLFCLLSTQSYSGLLALFASLLYLLARIKGFRWAFISLSIFLIGGSILLSIDLAYLEKLQAIFQERSSLSSRLMIWTTALALISDYQVWGIGIGKFQEMYLAYQVFYPPYLEWAVPQPHNFFLALWLQTGIIGLVATLFFVQRIFFSSEQNKAHKESLVLKAILIGILVYGLFDTPLFGNALAFIWWLVLSLLLFPQKKITEKDYKEDYNSTR